MDTYGYVWIRFEGNPAGAELRRIEKGEGLGQGQGLAVKLAQSRGREAVPDSAGAA